MREKTLLYLCCLLILGIVTGCGNIPGSSSDTRSSRSSGRNDGNRDGLPPIQEGGSIQAPVAIPPSFDLPEPGAKQDAFGRTANTALSQLQPMKSVNVESLFSEEITDTGQRLDRVEQAVLQMHKEFETLKPSIIRLVAVESDIQELVKQLDVLLQEEAASYTEPIPIQSRAPPVAAQKPEPEPLQTISEQISVDGNVASVSSASKIEHEPLSSFPSSAVANDRKTIVKALRVGEHENKVRLVLDLTGEAMYRLDLDNEEFLLVLELPDTGWIAEKQKTFGKNSLLSSYTVKSRNIEAGTDEHGTQLVFSLKKSTRILQKKILPPNSSNPNYRIFFDLAL